jgi:acyl-CoA dehydrogenase
VRDGVDFSKTSTAGGPALSRRWPRAGATSPPGSRSSRCLCWKTAHYLDQHDYHGEPIGATCKVHCTELRFDAVFKFMQVVGVKSVDRTHLFEKYLREATIRPSMRARATGATSARLSEARGASCRC